MDGDSKGDTSPAKGADQKGGMVQLAMERRRFMALLAGGMLASLLTVETQQAAGEGAKEWYLMEPPVDETSNISFGVLDQAPLTQWHRIATYDTQSVCESKRNEAAQASREETLRLSKTSPLPKLEIFKGAYRDSRLAHESTCVPADDPRLTSASAR